jgi:cytochrome oxidase Cu insertion factor (SCO1/SenC/PrrC family)
MIKKAVSFVLMLLAAGVAAAQSQSQPQSQPQTPATAPAKVAPPVPHTSLKVGQPAPDFTLASTIAGPDGRSVRYKLSDFKGKKNVVLAFYVLAFTGG